MKWIKDIHKKGNPRTKQLYSQQLLEEPETETDFIYKIKNTKLMIVVNQKRIGK